VACEQPLRFPAEAWDILQSLFKEQKINDHTLHFAASFSGKLDLDLLKNSVSLSADAFPLIRCRFNNTGRRPYWEEIRYSTDEMVSFSETGNAAKNIDKFLGIALDETIGATQPASRNICIYCAESIRILKITRQCFLRF
jgi:NRPS condensation-like uncharacterized protein